MRRDHHIHLIGETGELERLGGVMLPRVIREVRIHGAAVNRELAGPRAEKNARDRFLAASRAVEPCLSALTERSALASKWRFSSAQRSSSINQPVAAPNHGAAVVQKRFQRRDQLILWRPAKDQPRNN